VYHLAELEHGDGVDICLRELQVACLRTAEEGDAIRAARTTRAGYTVPGVSPSPMLPTCRPRE
jgi:hypothetical protein